MRKVIRRGVAHALPPGYAVDTHFNPRYGPWDQRLCLVPDGDLFKALSTGRASMVTDTIERFTARRRSSSRRAIELEADIVDHRDRPATARARRRRSSRSTASRSCSPNGSRTRA